VAKRGTVLESNFVELPLK